MSKLSVREVEKADIPLLVNYWLSASDEYLLSMGVDTKKIPSKLQLTNSLSEQLGQKYKVKTAYCMIWLVDGKPVGHSNVNKIVFGKDASMHLHFWDASLRGKGYGPKLVKMTVPYFFKNLKLKKLYSEPYALNPAPNKALEKAGFTLVKTYTTIPGWINFEQEVNRWELEPK